MSHLFRNEPPVRTYNGKELSDYKRYKSFLVSDFKKRCGYTNCHHFWFGGQRNFQIDHFNPKSSRPDLTTKYSNLVYSCSYVNRAKSNIIGDFLDPCDTDFNNHFYRDNLGNIKPLQSSKEAIFMYKALK